MFYFVLCLIITLSKARAASFFASRCVNPVPSYSCPLNWAMAVIKEVWIGRIKYFTCFGSFSFTFSRFITYCSQVYRLEWIFRRFPSQRGCFSVSCCWLTRRREFFFVLRQSTFGISKYTVLLTCAVYFSYTYGLRHLWQRYFWPFVCYDPFRRNFDHPSSRLRLYDWYVMTNKWY